MMIEQEWKPLVVRKQYTLFTFIKIDKYTIRRNIVDGLLDPKGR